MRELEFDCGSAALGRYKMYKTCSAGFLVIMLAALAGCPPTSITFTLEQAVTIAEEMGHLAFPDVARLADGRIALVYRQGASHVDPSGLVMAQFGSEDGLTWSDPAVILDTPGIDDRDPSVALLADGRLLVTWFPYDWETIGGSRLTLHEVFGAFSSDQGETFPHVVQISDGSMSVEGGHIDEQGLWADGAGEAVLVWACSSPAVEYQGRILLPAYGGHALNLSQLATHPRSWITLFASDDGGETWARERVETGGPADTWLMEPSLLPVRNGPFRLHIRTADGTDPGGPGQTAQSFSFDGGAVWAPWQDLDFIGHAPNLYQLQNGAVLSAFRWVSDSYTVASAAFVHSLDDGKTWSHPIEIEYCAGYECGYPSILELPGNRVLFVYYGRGGASIKGAIYSFEMTAGSR